MLLVITILIKICFLRQTRMLADLSLIGCYNSSYMNQEERDRVMLASAKRNLLSIAFFGLTEFQKVNIKDIMFVCYYCRIIVSVKSVHI